MSLKRNVVLERYGDEAKILAGMNHPNIATLCRFEEETRVRFLIMEVRPRVAGSRSPQ